MRDTFSLPPLSQLTQQLTSGPGERGNLAEALLHLTREALRLFSPDICLLTAYHPITGELHYTRTLHRARPYSPSHDTFHAPILPQEALLACALDGKRPDILCVPDLSTTPHFQSDYLRDEQVRSLVAFPFWKEAEHPPFGTLTLAFRVSRDFSPDDQEALRQFAQLASFILQETWLLQRYREITHIGQIINQEVTTVETLLQTLHPLINNVLDARHALMLAIYQAPTHTRDLYGIDEGHYIREDNRAPSGASRYALQERQPVLIRHLSAEATHLPFRVAPVHGTEPKESFIYIPLLMGDIPLGVLSIQHPQPRAYSQEDVALLDILANHITLAINNIRLYDSLIQLNETGRLLTSQIELQHPLQATLQKIQVATGAETVLLYPTLASHTAYDGTPLQPLLEGAPLISHLLSKPFWSWQDFVMEKMTSQRQTLFEPECLTTRESLLLPIRSILAQENIRSLAIMPLHVEQEAVGVLSLFFQQTQYFDTPQKLLIEGLAHFAAIAIRNAQTFNGLLQRRIHELEILQKIDKELNSTLSLDAILASLLRNACTFVPAEGATILLYDSKKQVLETRAVYGTNTEEDLAFKIPLSEVRGLTGWSLHYKQPVRVNNVHLDSPWNKLYVNAAPNTTSELDIPLLDGGRAIGVLNFESSREGAFRQEDQDFSQTLAGQAVLAITKAQAYEREQRLASERQVLYDIGKELTSQLDTQRVFELILDKALELMQDKSRTGCLMLYDRERQQLWMAAERGVLPDKKGREHSVNEGIVGQVARTRQLLNVDPLQPGWKDIYLSYIRDTRSELAVPMIASGELKGVLNIESPEEEVFNESDERLLQGLADLAVVALRNAELYQEAEKEKQHFMRLYRISSELGEINDINQLEQVYQIVFGELVDYSQGYIELCRYHEVSDSLLFICSSTTNERHQSLIHDSIYHHILTQRQKLVINDITQLPSLTPLDTDPDGLQSLIILPIMFKGRFYGTLALAYHEVQQFSETDIDFYDSMAQQIGSTIYRLEAAQTHLESEQRAQAAEEVSLIGQSALELTHRLGNDLGLVETYISSVKQRLKKHNALDPFVERKLDKTTESVRTVLDLSTELKEVLADPTTDTTNEVVTISPRVLLEQARNNSHLPGHIQVRLEVDDDIDDVYVRTPLVADILRNLITNAIEAMQNQPKGLLVLRAFNSKDKVAIQVQDNGQGINPQISQKIFSLFYSTKESSGFGLWSARRNALRLNGDLELENPSQASGTIFTLHLPKNQIHT